MLNWRPFPGQAPRDRAILVRCVWKAFDVLPGGQTTYLVIRWSALDQQRKTEGWYVNSTTIPLDLINVDVREWADLDASS